MGASFLKRRSDVHSLIIVFSFCKRWRRSGAYGYSFRGKMKKTGQRAEREKRTVKKKEERAVFLNALLAFLFLFLEVVLFKWLIISVMWNVKRVSTERKNKCYWSLEQSLLIVFAVSTTCFVLWRSVSMRKVEMCNTIGREQESLCRYEEER